MVTQLVTRAQPRWLTLTMRILGIVLIVGVGAFWLWSIWTHHETTLWIDLASAVIAIIGAGGTLLPILFTKKEREVITRSQSGKLKRDDLNMGDDAATYFPYIKMPIEQQYHQACAAIRQASLGKRGGKRGLLLLGEANTGKTRMAFEVVNEVVPDWFVILLPSKDDVEDPRGRNVVVFIDDVQKFALPVVAGSEISTGKSSGDVENVRSLLSRIRDKAKRVVVVVTCRAEEELRVRRGGFGWLFNDLEVVYLPSFRDASDTDVAEIQNEFQQKGAEHLDDWDGTLGSLVLGLSKKQDQYAVDLSEQERSVLRAMKLLAWIGINDPTEQYVSKVCTDVFFKQELQANTETWRSVLAQLAQLQFVRISATGEDTTVQLSIRKDAYFDKVVTDYLMPEDTAQLAHDFALWRNILVQMKDIQGLIKLGNTFYTNELYPAGIATYDQALLIDSNNADCWNWRGLGLSEMGKYAEALDSYEHALAIHSDVAYLWLNKGVTLYNLGKREEALLALDRALELDSQNSTTWGWKGFVLIALNRYEEAVVAYQNALEIDPNGKWDWYNKGLALENVQRYDEALDAYRHSVAVDARFADGWVKIGNILERQEKFEDALHAYTQATSSDSQFADAWMYQGSLLSDMSQDKEALVAYEHALQLDPNSASTWFLKCVSLFVLARYSEALDAIVKAIELDATQIQYMGVKANILFQLAQYDEAIQLANQVLERNADYELALNVKLSSLLKLKRYDEVKAIIEHLQTLHPDTVVEATKQAAKSQNAILQMLASMDVDDNEDDVTTLLVKASYLSLLKRYEETVTVLNKALALQPDNAILWNLRGDAFGGLKKLDEALQDIEHALSIDPDYKIALLNKSAILMYQEKLEQALADIDHVLTIDPKMVYAWNIKGNILIFMKEYEQAVQAFDQALALDDKNAITWTNKSKALLFLKRVTQGLEASQIATKLSPELGQDQLMQFLSNQSSAQSKEAADAYLIENPQNANEWFYNGSLLFGQQRLNEALQAIDNALALDSTMFMAWQAKTNVLILQKKFQEALVACNQVITLNPEFDQGWVNKGAILLQLRQYKAALYAFDKTITLNPKNTSVWQLWLLRGEAYAKLKQYQEALSAYERTLALNDDLSVVFLKKAAMQTQLKHYDEAVHTYRQALILYPALQQMWRVRMALFFLRLRGAKENNSVASA